MVSESIEIATENQGGFDKDLSVWGMYQNADNVVKTVMIGLVLASVITWALFFSKGIELLAARRRLKAEVAQLNKVKSLDEAMSIAEGFKANSVTRLLLNKRLWKEHCQHKAQIFLVLKIAQGSVLSVQSLQLAAIWGVEMVI